jgi:hypothetical protein
MKYSRVMVGLESEMSTPGLLLQVGSLFQAFTGTFQLHHLL